MHDDVGYGLIHGQQQFSCALMIEAGGLRGFLDEIAYLFEVIQVSRDFKVPGLGHEALTYRFSEGLECLVQIAMDAEMLIEPQGFEDTADRIRGIDQLHLPGTAVRACSLDFVGDAVQGPHPGAAHAAWNS